VTSKADARGDERVLIVDDNGDMRELYAAYLTHKGLEAHTADGGESALRQAHRLHPHVIVMDLMMPEITGIDAIRQLKLDDRTKHIPVIALTGNLADETRRAALDARCDAFVTKPCRPDALLAEIRRVLER
jgi:two-component system, cell cycle response regulator DivK